MKPINYEGRLGMNRTLRGDPCYLFGTHVGVVFLMLIEKLQVLKCFILKRMIIKNAIAFELSMFVSNYFHFVLTPKSDDTL